MTSSSTSQSTTRPTNGPIFILGMLQRTGTNHLWDLIGLHPDTFKLEPVFEDHLLKWSGHLDAYVDDVTAHWSPDWNVPASERAALLRSLGSGLAGWVAGHSERRVVTKMPSVEQVGRFFDLFDDSPLVVLVRDGRNVSESGVTSFGWSYERAFRRWSRAADVVLDVVERFGDDPRLAVVKYEDVVDRPADVMRRLCVTTGLDVDRYPFDAIDALPVRGSSTLRVAGEGAIHWAPTERAADFDPHARWQSWDDHRHRRFAAVAGAQQRALGYECLDPAGSDGALTAARDLLDSWSVRARETRVKAGRARRAVGRIEGSI